MSDETFSLAVVRGASRGKVLRTKRSRVLIGSSAENDLVLDDAGIPQRHFMVLTEPSRWRIHPLVPGTEITVDRRWTHPETGQRGALIFLDGGAEILAFPGKLEKDIIVNELRRRSGSASSPSAPRASANGGDLVVRITREPVDFPMDNTPPGAPVGDFERLVTVEVPKEESSDDFQDATEIYSGQDAELGGADFEDQTVALPAEVPKSAEMPRSTAPRASAWDRAAKPRVDDPTPLPEVLAEPESRMMAVPGAGKSVMAARPDFLDGGPPASARVIDVSEGGGSALVKSAGGSRGTNAWGDREDSGSALEIRKPERAEPKGSAWGDPRAEPPRSAWDAKPRVSERSLQASVASEEPPRKKNAWGDAGALSEPLAPAADASAQRPVPPGIEVAIEGLSKSRGERALGLLHSGETEFATSIRLLVARVDTIIKTHGYRAFMFTSPEPLTGKTTTIVNLALALSEDTDRRIAVVEANFRFPRLHEILGVDARLGLIPVLEGKSSIQSATVRIGRRNLVFLPTGGRHPRPAEALAATRFKTLIAQLMDAVDILLVDAPSARPSADAHLILPLVDVAFLVVAHGHSRAGSIGRAVSALGSQRIIGAVYNHIPGALGETLRAERRARFKLKGG